MAKAYAYHLLAMFEAKNRRPKNKLESEAIKKAFMHFMTWGITKIKKKMRLLLFGKIVMNFPQLFFKRIVISGLWGVINLNYE